MLTGITLVNIGIMVMVMTMANWINAALDPIEDRLALVEVIANNAKQDIKVLEECPGGEE